METKFFFAQVKKIDENARTIDATASTIDLDRDHDIILPSAFERSLKPFKDNPVILACHQHRLSTGNSPVIGSAIPDSIKIDEKKVLFTMRFAETPLGEEYWQLYRDKHMRAFSIGFIPIEHEDKKDEKLGWIRTYTKIELLEISAVPVPSNRRALVRAKSYLEDELAETIKTVIDEKFDILLDEIKSILIADPDGLARSLLSGPSDQSAPAGDNQKAERIVVKIKQLIEKTS